MTLDAAVDDLHKQLLSQLVARRVRRCPRGSTLVRFVPRIQRR